MTELKATDVFTPASFPAYTYIERGEKKFEERLWNALQVPGQVVSLSGPSKSGKIVLVEKVVTLDNLIVTTGAGVDEPDHLWNRVLDWMDVPSERTEGTIHKAAVRAGGEVGGGFHVPLVAKVEAKLHADVEGGRESSKEKTFRRGGFAQVVREIGNSDFVRWTRSSQSAGSTSSPKSLCSDQSSSPSLEPGRLLPSERRCVSITG